MMNKLVELDNQALIRELDLLVVLPFSSIMDTGDARCECQFYAGDAWPQVRVEESSKGGLANLGRLGDYGLLGMNANAPFVADSSHHVLCAPWAAGRYTVRKPFVNTVAGGEPIPLFWQNDGSDLPANAVSISAGVVRQRQIVTVILILETIHRLLSD
jgi:hypothetical protein